MIGFEPDDYHPGFDPDGPCPADVADDPGLVEFIEATRARRLATYHHRRPVMLADLLNAVLSSIEARRRVAERRGARHPTDTYASRL